MRRIEATVRDYAWGSDSAIPDLLGTAPTGRPQAEMWIGAHPGAPSLVVDEGVGLDEWLSQRGDGMPYLMKVLAAAQPLSLQVHPTIAQAREGFAAEEQAGVPLDDPARNYKDANHKPEILVALSDFAALCGFRHPAAVLADLTALVGEADAGFHARLADALANPDEPAALRDAFTMLLSGDPAIGEFVARVVAAAAARPDVPSSDTITFAARFYGNDPGVVAAMMLNRVNLAPGEAIYLDAGVVHAYLHGLGIEAMSQSDNVLRGGLTPKHVDVPELARVVRFAPSAATLIDGVEAFAGGVTWTTWSPPVDEFAVHSLVADAGCRGELTTLPGPVVLLVAEGELTFDGELTASRGDTVFFEAGEGAWFEVGEHGVTAWLTSAGDSRA